MKKNGIKYRRDKTLGWRGGNSVTDIDASGQCLDYHWIAYVRKTPNEPVGCRDWRPLLPGLTYITHQVHKDGLTWVGADLAHGPWRVWRGKEIRSWYYSPDGGYVSKGIEHRVDYGCHTDLVRPPITGCDYDCYE